jgi:hypothetical protein
MRRGLKPVSHRRDDALSRVGWERLEQMLAEHYRAEGYVVEHVGTGRARSRYDGGIDLKLRKDDEYIVVQCKHWNAFKVTHNPVHELFGVMAGEGATSAILATSGEFTRAAVEAAGKLKRVQLLDGDALRRMLGPLPEPDPAPVQELSAPVANGITANADDRLVRPVNVRAYRPAAPLPAKGPASALGILLKLAFAAALLLFLGNALQRAIGRGSAPPSRSPPSTPAPQAIAAQRGSELQAAAAPGATWESASATSLKRTTKASPVENEAALREWRRRNAESMKILEATTPELPRNAVRSDMQ